MMFIPSERKHSRDGTISTQKTNSPPSESWRSGQRGNNGIVPVDSSFIILLSILFSALFVSTIILAFIGARTVSMFKAGSDWNVVFSAPGIVLLGQSVDVDIDEPAVTIRWSIIACGEGLILPGSPRQTYGGIPCGIPTMPLQVYVDSMDEPELNFDPSLLPTNPATGLRIPVQDLLQFDSDHILNVPDNRLYPFDTYSLTSTLRAVTRASNSSESSDFDTPITIIGLPVLKYTTAFSISSHDYPTTMSAGPGISATDLPVPSRDVTLHISRPNAPRAYAMLLFAVNWALTHISCGVVILALYRGPASGGTKGVMKQFTGLLALMLVIPQLRGAMPDAPGFDGVLIDIIGFFPQMVITGISTLCLLLILVKRELDSDLMQMATPLSWHTNPAMLSQTQEKDITTTPEATLHSEDNESHGEFKDLAPLIKARSSMDNNHFRKMSLTSADLIRAAQAPQQPSYSRLFNIPDPILPLNFHKRNRSKSSLLSVLTNMSDPFRAPATSEASSGKRADVEDCDLGNLSLAEESNRAFFKPLKLLQRRRGTSKSLGKSFSRDIDHDDVTKGLMSPILEGNYETV